MNAFGSRNAEDVSAGLAGVVLYRSHDGGVTWGDSTVVAYGTPENGNRYSENSFVVYPDGTWVLLSRLHCRHRTHMAPLMIVRTISRDRGRMWTAPEPVLEGGAPALTLLPDGGLVCATSEGVLFSYNRGRSWTYKPTYANSKPFSLADGTLLLVGGHYHWHWTTGANRHTFITNLASAGVHPKVAQTVARHSDVNLTMGIYSHVDVAKQAAAINTLPAPPVLAGASAVSATGATVPEPVSGAADSNRVLESGVEGETGSKSVAPIVAPAHGFECLCLASADADGPNGAAEVQNEKPLPQQGLVALCHHLASPDASKSRGNRTFWQLRSARRSS